MNKIGILFLFLTFKLFSQNSNVKTYFPQVFFNKTVAENALSKGKSTIRGTAFVNTGGLLLNKNKQFAKNQTIVMLFPITDYFAEWYELKKSNTGSLIMMLPEAFAFRLETTTDEYGNFEFPRMKPGKYYLESTVDYVGTGTGRERTGTIVSSWGYGYSTTPIYENYYYNYDAQKKVNKIVEITEDGQLIEIKLRPKAFEHLASGNPSSSQCYQIRNQQSGTCKEFYKDGTLKIVAGWKNGLLEGNYVEYNSNRTKNNEGKMKKGFKVDVWKYYDLKKDFLSTAQNYVFKDNISKLHGEAVFYYPSGKILQIDLYKNGLLQGESKLFYENGNLQNKVMYENGVLNNKAYYYDINGKLTKETMYKNGIEIK